MSKTFKAFAGKNWVTLTSGEAFREADKAGKPIRVEFANGSFKVIKNSDKLPEGQPSAFTKAAADREAAKQKEAVAVEPESPSAALAAGLKAQTERDFLFQ
jgi:hypothetical protein|tara:strand:- start:156 stop:458 length:303 start_codon:yes stop_codon:yes gene_type:complete